MAKVKMKKIEVVTVLEESKKVFDFLQVQGVVELFNSEEKPGLSPLTTAQTALQVDKYLDTCLTALSIIDRYAPEKKPITASLRGLPEISMSEYLEKSEKIDKTLSYCYDICSCEKTVSDTKVSVARLEAARKLIEPWIDLDVPMRYKGTDTTAAFIGTLPADYTKQTLETALSPLIGEDVGVECEIISNSRDRSCIFALCAKDNSEEVFSALRTLGFAYPSDATKHPPRVRFDRIGAQISSEEEKFQKAKDKIIALAEKRDEIRFACDCFKIRRDKYAQLENVCVSDFVMVMGGYVPEQKAEDLIKKLENRFTVAVTLTNPDETDSVPVLFENKPFVAAVEPITEMYAMPSKQDIDPNPVMSVFYYLLFGIMLSDAGYGLLMAIGCGIAKFKFKVTGKLKKTVDMYFWCGIATVFWGALFGSWFGDIVPRVAQQFFGVADIGVRINTALGFELFHGVADNPGSIAIWFEPVNNPTKLLLYSFLFGIIHLFAGVILGMVKMIKQKNIIGALCDGIPVMLLVVGIAPLGANIIGGEGTVDASISGVMIWVALAGAVLIVLTAGRDSKNIIGKLGIGLYGLYNAASGWMGDILSYSRLLALGLCTGVIATVVNTLGTIPDSKAAKLGLLVPVFIFGHIVNMAINLIGTYVHTNRLQYVEFFAKFYEGGGRSFTPLKTDTKYIKIMEDK
ncbi:MAG: V-type ATP synthase subunit I [Clostridiales bacterium]|nr:V-type ATP synthase subunit I [Clostridiales bacterium]